LKDLCCLQSLLASETFGISTYVGQGGTIFFSNCRCRIQELERELEEITRKAMTSQTRALQTARQMAAAASLEDEASMAASTKKTRKVITESSSKISSA
jgi:hypothetical protein